jgi:hypothetical protein
MKALVELGADINRMSPDDGVSAPTMPLHVAAAMGNAEMTQVQQITPTYPT